jgi:hypothetical protein
MEVLKDEGKSESMMSGLDDMWYTGDKESNIQDYKISKMNIWLTKKASKKR